MKKISLVLALVVALGATTYAQKAGKKAAKSKTQTAKSKGSKKRVKKADVPTEVTEQFTVLYPNIDAEDWYAYDYYWDTETDEVEEDSLIEVEYLYPEFYEVDFMMESKPYRSIFSRIGEFIETRRIIKEDELPSAVSNALKKGEYKDWELVGEREKVEKTPKKETLYRVRVRKGKERQVLLFDSNGKLVQAKKIKLKV